MKDLKILSEITTRYGNRNINEIEFKTPEDFAAYKKKHKMRPGTVVKVAGKDKVIDDPKKNTKPKGNKTADTLTKGLKDGGLNPYKDGPLINQALDDIGGDHSDLKKRIDTYGDNVPSSKGKSEAQYQKEIDKYKEEGEKLSNDIADAVSDKPKGRRMQITMDFNNASREDLEGFAKKYDLKLGIVDNNPNYGLEAEFEGSEENLKRFMTSDDYGLDEKDFDDYAREYGDVLDDDESETESKPYSAKDEIDDAIDQGDGDTAMELFQSEVGFKKMGKDGKEAKKLLDRLADYEYGLIDLDDEEQDDIQDRLKQLSNKYLGDDSEKDEPKAEPQSSNEAPVSGEPKIDEMEMEDTLNATLDDVGFGGQDTSGLEDIIYTYEDDLKEAGVLRDIQDDLALLQQIQSDDPSNPEDVPYEERERAVDRIRGKFEQADIIAESVNNLRQLSKITTRYNK
jgi:acylphosphatase